MQEILIKAGSFGGIIVLGYLLKRMGFFKQEDFPILSKIMMNITLPAAVIVNLSKNSLVTGMLIYCLCGLLCGLVLMTAGIAAGHGKPKEEKAFRVLNMTGYNIGSFTMPFVQGFLGPTGVIVTSLFDTGNSVICLGGTYTLAAMIKGERQKRPLRRSLCLLLRSVPFVTYLIMTVLCLNHLQLPAPVLSFAEIIAGGNAFMAMLMIGVGMDVSGCAGHIRKIVGMLGIRYALGVILAAVFLLMPFPVEHKKTLVILALSPITSAAPAFTGKLGGDVGAAGVLNSLSILISIVLVTLVLLLWF